MATKKGSKVKSSASLSFGNLKADPLVVDTSIASYQKKRKNGLRKQLFEAQKKESKLEELTRQGELSKAVKMKMDDLWASALLKSEGGKNRPDAKHVKKKLKRVEKNKERSRKKWQERTELVERQIEKRQEKRRRNMQKRRDSKMQAKSRRRK